jgi:hypothetical protein
MKLKPLLSVSALTALALGAWACADRLTTSTPADARTAATAAATDEGGRAAAAEAVEKVTICHIPPGNPDNAHTITVGEPAVAAHIEEHGDTMGPCPEPSPSPTPEPTPTPGG